MTTTNRIDRIKAFKEQNDNKAIQQQRELDEHREALEKCIYDLTDRITELIEVANACIQNGIKIECRDYLGFTDGRKGYDGGHFVADGIYHRVGFIVKRNHTITHIGIRNGGACGETHFKTNGEEFIGYRTVEKTDHITHNVSFVDEPCQARIEDMEKFLANFDEFEEKFYAYVDKITEVA